MRTTMAATGPRQRRGITLMEVLISIGILAIGLTSVMSLIPAGKSEAGKAVIADRTVALAINAINDALVFGICRPASISSSDSSQTTVIFDPTSAAAQIATASESLKTQPGPPSPAMAIGSLKAAGIYANPQFANDADAAVLRMICQGRDDVVFTRPASPDDRPASLVRNGTRAFEGKTTCMLSLSLADNESLPMAEGKYAVISAVVFHSRDYDVPIIQGSLNAAGLLKLSSIPSGRSLRALVRPGAVVCFYDPVSNRVRFAQLSMASATSDSVDAYVSFLAKTLPTSQTNVLLLADSVGLYERTIRLEAATTSIR